MWRRQGGEQAGGHSVPGVALGRPDGSWGSLEEQSEPSWAQREGCSGTLRAQGRVRVPPQAPRCPPGMAGCGIPGDDPARPAPKAPHPSIPCPPCREGGSGDTTESSAPKPAPSVEMFPGRCLGLLILWDQPHCRPRCLGRGGHTHVPAQGTLWEPRSPLVTLPVGVHTGTAKRGAVALAGCPPVPVPIPVTQREPSFPAISPRPGPSPPSPVPFTLLLPGCRIKAQTCESRGTKGRHKGSRSPSALPAASGPKRGPAGLTSASGMSGQPSLSCPQHPRAQELRWGRGMPLGPGGPP